MTQPETVPPPVELRPGGPQAVAQGCRCDPVDNCDGHGVGPLAVVVGDDGVARRADRPLYLVDEGCPVHPLPEED